MARTGRHLGPPPLQHSLIGPPAPAKPHKAAFVAARANGYAAQPGTGPEGETCGSCSHCRYRTGNARRFYKCALMLHAWSNCRGTDVLLSSAACRRWEAGTPRPSTTRIYSRAGGEG